SARLQHPVEASIASGVDRLARWSEDERESPDLPTVDAWAPALPDAEGLTRRLQDFEAAQEALRVGRRDALRGCRVALGELGEQRRRPLLPQSIAHPLRSEEHTSELQSRDNLVCRLLLEKKEDRAQMHARGPG